MEWMFYDIRNRWRHFTTGLYNIIKWRKTIWNDRDWDYFFIYQILKKKLEFQRDHIKKYSNHENFQRDIDTLTECIDLIDKVQNEYYINLEIDKEPWTKETFERAYTNHEEARKNLFKKLEQNIEYWWD